MSLHMRYIRLNLLKACHLRGVPYTSLAEAHCSVPVPLAQDDSHNDGYISSQELSEYLLSNTYSALNNLVLRRDEIDAKTCTSQNPKPKSPQNSMNPIEHALTKRDFDFLLSLGRGIQPALLKHTDLHKLKCHRDSNTDKGVSLFTEQSPVTYWSEAPEILRHSKTVDLSTLHCDTGAVLKNELGTEDRKDPKKERRGPDEEQLEIVKQYYIHITPIFMKKGEDYTAGLHDYNMVFENYYFEKPKIVQGLVKYDWELTKMRLISYLKYTHFAFQPRSVTTHLDEQCVKLHWRLYYQSQWKLLKFWEFKFWKKAEDKYDWVEGISTFYVNKDGKIIKHRVDRTVPFPVKEARSKGLPLASILGLAPTSKFWDAWGCYKKIEPPTKQTV